VNRKFFPPTAPNSVGDAGHTNPGEGHSLWWLLEGDDNIRVEVLMKREKKIHNIKHIPGKILCITPQRYYHTTNWRAKIDVRATKSNIVIGGIEIKYFILTRRGTTTMILCTHRFGHGHSVNVIGTCESSTLYRRRFGGVITAGWLADTIRRVRLNPSPGSVQVKVPSCSARTAALIAGLRFVSYWLFVFAQKANGFPGAAFAGSDYQSEFLSSRFNLFLAVYQTLAITGLFTVSCDIFLCWGTVRHCFTSWTRCMTVEEKSILIRAFMMITNIRTLILTIKHTKIYL